MRKSPVVLAIAALLFVGWLTFLGYQAVRDRRPVVVSRAQLAISQYDVEADLAANPGKDSTLPLGVRVKVVRWKADDGAPPIDEEITVLNLDKVQGYQGKGRYLLPLVRGPKGKDYEVAGLPLDPGYPPLREPPKPRIYLLSAAEKQLEQVFKAKEDLRTRGGSASNP